MTESQITIPLTIIKNFYNCAEKRIELLVNPSINSIWQEYGSATSLQTNYQFIRALLSWHYSRKYMAGLKLIWFQ